MGYNTQFAGLLAFDCRITDEMREHLRENLLGVDCREYNYKLDEAPELQLYHIDL
jgi:hypothetical protein